MSAPTHPVPVVRKYGVIPERIPVEHLKFRSTLTAPAATLPSIVDLRNRCPPVYDQTSLGSFIFKK